MDKHLQASRRWPHEGTTLTATYNIQEATQLIMQGFTMIDLYKVVGLYNKFLGVIWGLHSIIEWECCR